MVLGAFTWVRAAWTAAAAVGVGVTLILLVMAITDYRLLFKRELNGWRRYVARTSILIFLGGFGTQMIYFLAGIVSIIWGPKTEHISGAQAVDGALFIFGAVSSIVLAIIIFFRRRIILEVIESHIEKNGDIEA